MQYYYFTVAELSLTCIALSCVVLDQLRRQGLVRWYHWGTTRQLRLFNLHISCKKVK